MTTRRRIAIMGGSFNPVHVGHVMVADFVRQSQSFDKVVMVMSPQNPFKADSDQLISDNHRVAMLEIACRDVQGLEACDVELTMPRPSYTIDTLDLLSKQMPDADISIIIGSDNYQTFGRWKDADRIVSQYGVIVYPRPGWELPDVMPKGFTRVDAPTVNLSSTEVRELIARGYDMNLFLPRGVYNYICQHKLYQ